MNYIKIYNIQNITDIESIQLVVTNKNSLENESPTVQNGIISNYTWKRNNEIIKSGSSNNFRYYSPTEADINQLLSCEVTATSNYNFSVKKYSYIQIVLIEENETDYVPETDIVIETDYVPETDIVIETDYVPETDIVIEPLVFPDFRIADPYVLTITGNAYINRINQEQLIGLELILVERTSEEDTAITIDNLIQNFESINYKWYYFDDVDETEIGNQPTYIIKENDIDRQISCKISVIDLNGVTIEKINRQGGTNINYVEISVLNYFVPETFVLRTDLEEIDLESLEITDPLEDLDGLGIYFTSLGESGNYYPEYENADIYEVTWKINNNIVLEETFGFNNYLYLEQSMIDNYFDPNIENVLLVEIKSIPSLIVCNEITTDLAEVCPIIIKNISIPIILI